MWLLYQALITWLCVIMTEDERSGEDMEMMSSSAYFCDNSTKQRRAVFDVGTQRQIPSPSSNLSST